VVILSKREGEETVIEEVLTGGHHFSGFGWSLASADANNDGYDELFVGAPLAFDGEGFRD